MIIRKQKDKTKDIAQDGVICQMRDQCLYSEAGQIFIYLTEMELKTFIRELDLSECLMDEWMDLKLFKF